jgi:eukaryotic-like serine/threonine-protein kinase
MSNPKNPQLIKSLFLQALEIDAPEMRQEILVDGCAGDEELLNLLQKMLSVGASSRAEQLDRLAERIRDLPSDGVQLPFAKAKDVPPSETKLHTPSKTPGDSPEPISHTEFESCLVPGSRVGKQERMGPYEILELLGQGGMGLVYLAEQIEPVRRHVALKIIKPGMDSTQVIARFEAERQALSLMNHPNIAAALDAGTTPDGRPYFVMELVRGRPITNHCDENHLSTRERLLLIRDVCLAVQHAHQKGIIHRDIKPSNILVTNYDELIVPKVIDFGVAKAVSQALTDRTLHTGFGQIVGTLEYMSPEQSRVNQVDVDTRSDIYSLGVVLYEMLVGHTPIDRQRLRNATWEEMLRIIREEYPPTPSKKLSSSDHLASIAANRNTEPVVLNRQVQGELDWIVMKAIEKDPNRRYDSAKELAADIDRYLNGEQVLACPPTWAYRTRKFAKRNGALLATSSTLLAILLLGIFGTSWQAMRAMNAESELLEQLIQSNADRDEADRLRKVADEQAALAIAEQQRADREAATAKGIANFLEKDLLAMVDYENQQKGDLVPRRDMTVRELLDRVSVRLGGRADLECRSLASLHHTIGTAYGSLGVYVKAEKHLNRSLELCRECFGPVAAETMRVSCSLASLLTEASKLAQAEDLLNEIGPTIRGGLGTEGAEYRQFLGALMVLQFKQERFSEAKTTAEEIVRLTESIFGSHSVEHLNALGNLAAQYHGLGDIQRGASLRQRVYDLSRELLGDESLQTINALQQLGPVYFSLGDLPKALDAYDRAFPILRKAHDPDHPSLLDNQANRARILARMGRLKEAQPLAEATMHSVRNTLGKEHFLYRFMMQVLTEMYTDLGQLEKVAALIEESEAVESEQPSGDRRYVVRIQMSKFDLLQKQGNVSKAETLGRELLDAMDEALGPTDEDALTFKSNFGVFLYTEKRPGEALPLFEKIYEERRKKYGLNKIPTISAAFNRASALHAMGRKSDAYLFFEEVLQGHEKLAEKNVNAEALLNRYASNVQMDQQLPDRYERAEKLYGRLVQIFERQYGPHSIEAVRAVGRQGLMMINQSRYSDAEDLQRTWSQKITQALQDGLASSEARYLSLKQLADTLMQCQKYPEAEVEWRELISLQSASLGPFHKDTQASVGQLIRSLKSQRKLDDGERLLRERLKLSQEQTQVDAVLQSAVLLSEILELKDEGESTPHSEEPGSHEAIEILKLADAFCDEHGTEANKGAHGILLRRMCILSDSLVQFDLAEYCARKQIEIHKNQTGVGLAATRISRNVLLLRALAEQSKFDDVPQVIEACEAELALTKNAAHLAFEPMALQTKIWMAQGDYGRAEKVAEELVRMMKNSPPDRRLQAGFLQAEVQHLLGNTKLGDEMFSSSMEELDTLGDDIPSALRDFLASKAELHIAEGKFSDAAEILQRTSGRELQGEEVENEAPWREQLSLGRLRMEQGNLDAAEEIFRKLATTKPKAPTSKWIRYAAMSLLGECLALIEAAPKDSPEVISAEHLLTEGYQGMEKHLRILATSKRNRDFQLYSAANRVKRYYLKKGDPDKISEWQAIEDHWLVTNMSVSDPPE